MSAPVPDAKPRGTARNLGLIVAGGVAVGLLAGMMLPRQRSPSPGQRLSPRAKALLGMAGELGLTLAAQALTRAVSETTEQAQAGDAPSAANTKAPITSAPTPGLLGTILRLTGKR